jgi:hypothetical protein
MHSCAILFAGYCAQWMTVRLNTMVIADGGKSDSVPADAITRSESARTEAVA